MNATSTRREDGTTVVTIDEPTGDEAAELLGAAFPGLGEPWGIRTLTLEVTHIGIERASFALVKTGEDGLTEEERLEVIETAAAQQADLVTDVYLTAAQLTEDEVLAVELDCTGEDPVLEQTEII